MSGLHFYSLTSTYVVYLGKIGAFLLQSPVFFSMDVLTSAAYVFRVVAADPSFSYGIVVQLPVYIRYLFELTCFRSCSYQMASISPAESG